MIRFHHLFDTFTLLFVTVLLIIDALFSFGFCCSSNFCLFGIDIDIYEPSLLLLLPCLFVIGAAGIDKMSVIANRVLNNISVEKFRSTSTEVISPYLKPKASAEVNFCVVIFLTDIPDNYMKDRQLNLSCNMLEWSSFLISFSFENDR